MCTLTWWSDSEGHFEVFFNRDESKKREKAIPPREFSRSGVRFLAPIDPRGGGTWLMANEHGVTVALLNWYECEIPGEPQTGWKSRGQMVMELADSLDGNSLRKRIQEIDGSAYPPFRLVAFSPAASGPLSVEKWEWCPEGKLKQIDSPEIPICSSSFETAQVIAARQKRLPAFFQAGPGADREGLWRYHHDGTPPSAWTVRMNRPDAQTWSISRVAVSREEVRITYEAECPDLEGAAEAHHARLARSPEK